MAGAPRQSQSQAKLTPIDQSVLSRLVNGVRYAMTGKIPEAWFGPLEPLQPTVPEEQKESVLGRQFDYPVAFNLRVTPRAEEAVSFNTLRQFADAYDLVRLVIETRKDEVARLPWKIQTRGGDVDEDATDKAITAFLEFPDREHNWDEWIRILLEDMFVIDAACIYPRMTKGGKLYALEPVDGATIKRVIDEFGRTPVPPEPAYQQILHGVPAANYTCEELLYRPRNPRSHKIYGYSPVEQILLTVQTALRREMHTLEYYTAGSVPDLIVGVPKEWTPDHIRQFQEYWDQLMSGDSAERRRARFVPDGLNVHPLKPPMLKDWFDDWVARIVSYAFSVDVTPLVSQVNRATAEAHAKASQEGGLAPIKTWIKATADLVIQRYLGYPEKEFVWETEPTISPIEQAEIHKIYVEAGVLMPDEVRSDMGREPFTPKQLEEIEARRQPIGDEMDEDKEEEEASAKGALAKAGKSVLTHKRARHIKAERYLTDGIEAAFRRKAKRVVAYLQTRIGKEEQAAANALMEEMEWQDMADEILIAIGVELNDVTASVAQAAVEQAEDAVEEALDDASVRAAWKRRGTWARQNAIRWAQARAAEMVRIDGDANIIAHTIEGIRALIAAAMSEGLSPVQLALTIMEAYQFSRARAKTIAVTEMARADINGTLIGWRESTVVKTKFWFTVGDDKVEQHCQDNEAQGYIPLADMFGTGDDGPPAHPNCRCSLLAGLKERSNQEQQE